MSKSLGFMVMAFSVILFMILHLLALAPYIKYTVLIFGLGVGVVLLSVLPLLLQMGSLEEEDSAVEEADATAEED